MGIFKSMLIKEALHVVRDTRTMVITLFIPLILLILFGFAISTEVNNVRIVAVVERYNDEIQEILERFRINGYFDFKGMCTSGEADEILRKGDADAVLFLKEENGNVIPQIVVDASNTTIAQASALYIQNVVQGKERNPEVLMQTLYNPQLRSAYNFVPGILGMIVILVCAIMTSVSIVSEKENGTMNLLLVSPIKPYTIIMGKLIPYFILSCVMLAIMLIISYGVLTIPFSGNVVSVVLLSIIYIILSLSIGLLVSTEVGTQLTALIVSAVGFMLPVIMLSGMIFPIDNMPLVLQWVSCTIPARWYIAAMRKLMIQQLDLYAVWQETIILCSITLLLLVVAIKKFTKRSRLN